MAGRVGRTGEKPVANLRITTPEETRRKRMLFTDTTIRRKEGMERARVLLARASPPDGATCAECRNSHVARGVIQNQ